jgi:DNA-binding LacI/PurR family transcriptional regulator
MTDRPKLEDVAARVGVSTASVSLVLRNVPGPSAETRRRVLAAAEELGYRPDRTASLLARRRRHLLGVQLDVRNTFHAELVEHVHGRAEQLGYDVVLSTVTAGRDEQRAVTTLLDFRCEAVILLGPLSSAPRLAALARQVPVVSVGRRLSAPGVSVVRAADDRGAGLAVDHLVGLGHTTIAYVDGGRGAIAADRRRGHRAAMRRHGLEGAVLSGGGSEEAGLAAAAELLVAPPLPTAVVAFNDRVALGLLDAFARAGVGVPDEVSVVGYDDGALARLAHVNLTTVGQEARRQAEEAVTAAVCRPDGGADSAPELVLTPRLVERGSTATPRRRH